MTLVQDQTDPDRADPDNVSTLYKHLRVADVADALDGIGLRLPPLLGEHTDEVHGASTAPATADRSGR